MAQLVRQTGSMERAWRGGDPDGRMAGMAAQALARHEATGVRNTFLDQVRSSRHRSVRMIGLRYLAKQAKTDGEAWKAIRKAASSDSDAAIRREAKRFLEE